MAATDSRTKLLEASLNLFRTKGYAGTSVEEICSSAGVTKGSFFHHFKSKDELAVAAIDHCANSAVKIHESAPYRTVGLPIERLFAYLDFRKSATSEPIGMLANEVFETRPAIRDACGHAMDRLTSMLEADIAAAMKERKVDAPWFAHTLAMHMEASFQGALVVAKAKGDPAAVGECLEHLRRYLEFLFR